MTKISRNAPCPCGSGKKWKKCCMDKYEAPPEGVIHVPSIKATNAPLMDDMPNIFIATPWSHYQVSAGFSTSMINLTLAMPFPARFNFYKARHTADARNSICINAIEEGYSHIFMVDADHRFDDDIFIKLWKILEEHGHDNTIASGWATVRGGVFKGNTNVLFEAGKGLAAPPEDSIPSGTFQAYSVGSSCLLFHTAVLTKVRPPWFADLLVIDNALDIIEEEESDPGVIYWPLERRGTHDYIFGIRMTEAGVKIMVDSTCKLPHEEVVTI